MASTPRIDYQQQEHRKKDDAAPHQHKNLLTTQGARALTADWWDMTRTIAHYEREAQIGEGTYGQVYRARCKETGRQVALKKIRSTNHGAYIGLPPSVIREIKILKRLRHPRLVEMIEVVSSKGVEFLDEHDEHREEKKEKEKRLKQGGSAADEKFNDAREGFKGNLFLVLEYMSHDLMGLLDIAYSFSPREIKSIFKQLMEGLAYMHEQKFVHRDIKSSNILIDSYYRVKLADFGLARSIEPSIALDKSHDHGAAQDFTNKVITLWYRPPEILLGDTKYGCAVDVWSAGCILAELLLGRTLFCGQTDLGQLELIFDLLGEAGLDSWEGVTKLKLFRTGKVRVSEPKKKSRLREKYGSRMSAPALNLFEKLLELDPSKRLTASRALNSRYFLTDPRAPDNPEELGTLRLGDGYGEFHEFHEFQTKKKKKEVKAAAQKARDEAKERGVSNNEVQAIYDEVYREQMQRVQQEGNNALITDAEKEAKAKAFQESRQNEMNERKRNSRESGRNESKRSRRSSDDHEKRKRKGNETEDIHEEIAPQSNAENGNMRRSRESNGSERERYAKPNGPKRGEATPENRKPPGDIQHRDYRQRGEDSRQRSDYERGHRDRRDRKERSSKRDGSRKSLSSSRENDERGRSWGRGEGSSRAVMSREDQRGSPSRSSRHRRR